MTKAEFDKHIAYIDENIEDVKKELKSIDEMLEKETDNDRKQWLIDAKERGYSEIRELQDTKRRFTEDFGQ